jgi:hypothetical protein
MHGSQLSESGGAPKIKDHTNMTTEFTLLVRFAAFRKYRMVWRRHSRLCAAALRETINTLIPSYRNGFIKI